MSSEILHVRVPACAVGPDKVLRHSSHFQRELRVVAIGRQFGGPRRAQRLLLPKVSPPTSAEDHRFQFGPDRPIDCRRQSREFATKAEIAIDPGVPASQRVGSVSAAHRSSMLVSK
jgi:hypothetical protein